MRVDYAHIIRGDRKSQASTLICNKQEPPETGQTQKRTNYNVQEWLLGVLGIRLECRERRNEDSTYLCGVNRRTLGKRKDDV